MPEPPIGIEPMTYALRVTWSLAMDALAALIARVIALMALIALGLSGDPFHDPFHARALRPRHPSTVRKRADDMDLRPQAGPASGPTALQSLRSPSRMSVLAGRL